MYRHRFGEQVVEAKADVLHHHERHKAGAEQQQYGFDNLYPCRCQHAAEQDVHHHQNAHQHDRNVVVQTEQQLDQFTCPHHLGDEVKRHDHQRTTGRQNADRPLFQSVRGDVGKGIATQVTQALGDQEQNDRPAHQEAKGVDQPVVAGGEHQSGNPEERRGGHIVAGDRQPILEAGNIPACRVIVAA